MARSVAFSGSGDDLESRQSRAIEAQKIVSRLEDKTDGMRARDLEFFENVAEELQSYGVDANISFSRLAWLRDMYERY